MMHKVFIVISCLASSIVVAAEKSASDWAVRSAPYRVALHAEEKPGAHDVGWEIRLPDFGAGRPDMRDVVLLGSDGKEIGLDRIWRGTGRALLLLAESMPDGDAAAMLYFGGNSSRMMRSWSAKRSLLLETRRLPEGAKVATFASWQEAWNKSKVVDGAAFVPWIFHGENPYGDSSNFMSRYTGQLMTGDGGDTEFYTLSDDVSYVMIDGRPAIQWLQDRPPPMAQDKVPLAKVRLPKKSASVEYCHAVGNAPGAMVLGWKRDGKLGNVPPEAWLHPGRVRADAIESKDQSPIPLATWNASRYLGFGDEWYVDLRFSVPDPGDSWQIDWLWPDGFVEHGPTSQRLWMSLEPVKLVLRFSKGNRVIEGRQVLVIPREMEADSVNHPDQIKKYLELLGKEDPKKLSEPSRRAGFILASAFLTPADALPWGNAWLDVAAPSHGAWVSAVSLSVREQAKRDPKAALDRLLALPDSPRSVLGRTAELLEIDLRVFGLKDPWIVAMADRLRKVGDKSLAQMAVIRLGDYYLLNGRIDEAAQCFSEAISDNKDIARTAPVIDRAHSLAIEDLIRENHLDEARVKLESWERQHPAARIEGDQLLWRARVMGVAGDWQRALLDLETSLKIRPGSPEEIEVLFWHGRALFELDRKDEARKIWNSLIENFPKHERTESAKKWVEKP